MISDKNKSKAQIFLLLIVFVLFIMLANNIFKGFRFDLTENKLYTLGDGTLNIINELKDEVTLNYYFSDSLTQDDTYLRAYAKRIKELLEEYQLRSKGKIKLNIIDPIPFSDEEDDAMKYGLQGVPSKTKEENIFFGLVAANRYDSYKIIKFFDPGKEAVIEYEITKVLYSLLNIKKPKIGIMTSLPMFGGYNFTKNEPTPEWAIIQKIKPLFDVELIDKKTKNFNNFDILFLVHPKKLSNDYASTQEVIIHAVKWLTKNNYKPDIICCIYPTAPFIQVSDLLQGLDLIKSEKWDLILAATNYSYPIFRSFEYLSNGGLKMIFPKYFNSRSQDLPKVYHDTGQFYWAKPKIWKSKSSGFNIKNSIVEIPNFRAQDIDTVDDWQKAEVMFKILNKKL